MNVDNQIQQVRDLMQQGQWLQAKHKCARVVKKARGNLEARFLMGMIHGQLNEPGEAVSYFQKVIDERPDVAAVYNNLALNLEKLAKPQQAIEAFQNAIRLQSGVFEVYCNLASTLSKVGQFDAAISVLEKAAELNPRNSTVWGHIGTVLMTTGRYLDAETYFKKAMLLKPDDPALTHNLGQALRGANKYDEAVDVFRRLVELAPNDANSHDALGNIYNAIGWPEDALKCYEEALRLNPADDRTYFDRGLTYQILGDLDKAIASHREAIQHNPLHAQAYRALANTKRFKDANDPDITMIRNVLDNPGLKETDRMHIYFSLGKICEDLKDYAQSFPFYLEANKRKRVEYDYTIETDRDLMGRIKEKFPRDFFEKRADYGVQNNTEVPVFVVGMPRSGTSLTEQILASHPLVYGAGELEAMRDVLISIPELSLATFPQGIEQYGADFFEKYAAEYHARARRDSEGKPYVVDKMPQNFLYIGMIRLMFPQAKVIHCVRDPVDVCVSCFKRYFSGDIKFSYDLKELGQYYCLYRDLMAHWHDVLPGYIYDARYEDLISDQEGQSRKLLEFCGLEWNDACLSFYKTERSVKTNSYAQVRKPIYSSSVKLWKNYEQHLTPLLEELRKCDTGYDI